MARRLGTNPYTWQDAAPREDGVQPPSPSSLNLGVAMAVLYDPNRVVVPKLQVAQFQSDTPSGFVPAHLATLAPETAFPGAADPAKALDVHFDDATNWLVVPGVAQDGGVANRFKPMVDGRFHVHDWAFFFGNIRQNVRDRLAAHRRRYGADELDVVLELLEHIERKGGSGSEADTRRVLTAAAAPPPSRRCTDED